MLRDRGDRKGEWRGGEEGRREEGRGERREGRWQEGEKGREKGGREDESEEEEREAGGGRMGGRREGDWLTRPPCLMWKPAAPWGPDPLLPSSTFSVFQSVYRPPT